MEIREGMISVVSKFLNMFPDEILGLLLVRTIEFTMEIIPGA